MRTARQTFNDCDESTIRAIENLERFIFALRVPTGAPNIGGYTELEWRDLLQLYIKRGYSVAAGHAAVQIVRLARARRGGF